MSIKKEDALNYHSSGKPGKIEVVPTKMLSSQLDLALAYSPGVAEPCKEIHASKEEVYKYTAKGNLVAVITNGTAVLGLGNIGPEASKPVMEGKGVLFKKFAGIDVFDIEIDCLDPERFIDIVASLEPTFGGVNLEDIKAPECFQIEQALRSRMNIPVMHDDQHGTAIISGAALLNALSIVGKKIEELKLVVSGAGAAAISCLRLYRDIGVRPENVVVFDINGVLHKGRTDLAPIQMEFATNREVHNLFDALQGADMFLGLSAGNVLTPEMLQQMAADPIVFALANPVPEIDYHVAKAARPDIIMATGRSDFPNQVNNVLGFPYIFRGAMDVRATEINEAMKLAAVYAIAALAKEPVPESVNKSYADDKIIFGRNYLIPKPLDPRLITTISPAVAKAAMESGVAKFPRDNWEQYKSELLQRIGQDDRLMTRMINRAKQQPKRVVFAEADQFKILKAAEIISREGIAYPILLGNKAKIHQMIQEHNLMIDGCTIIDPFEEKDKRKLFGYELHLKRQRKGITEEKGRKLMRDRNYFGAMLVEKGEADAFISGLTQEYADTIRPALQVIGVEKGISRVAGMYIIITTKGVFFFADATVNLNPTAEELVDIVDLTARAVRFFDMEPRIAMLSYSNFNSAEGDIPAKMAQATKLAKAKFPELIIEGDIQANVAVDTSLQKEMYPFSALAESGANTFIFPGLASGNIAYKLLQEIGGAEAIGPLLMGMGKPVHILQLGSSVREIVNMVAIAVVDAQAQEEKINL
ncbi:MAG: NADP-dependent malic enzyme [Cytophagaceae bacterium]|jgi:malate dehydrogenase (oxaloacetate-decarboxylating)(NADP+)|nr:NADP-dependent malic enzyme [Cytophagaceae bacterium]